MWRFERSAGRFMRRSSARPCSSGNPCFSGIVHDDSQAGRRVRLRHPRQRLREPIRLEAQAEDLFRVRGECALRRACRPRTTGGCELQGLVRRQLVISLISRQAPDGGWYHGEWTDMMESHYRYHNGGVMLLAAAYEEWEILPSASRSTRLPLSSPRPRTRWRSEPGICTTHSSRARSLWTAVAPAGYRTGCSARHLRRSSSSILIWIRSSPSIAIARSPVAHSMSPTLRPRARLRVDCWKCDQRSALPCALLGRRADAASGGGSPPPSLPLRIVRRLSREKLLPKLHVVKRRYPRLVMPAD